MHRCHQFLFWLVTCTIALDARVAFSADVPSTQPSYYETAIQLVGEEDDGSWSLRLPDAAFREPATFRLLVLWKYQPAEKKWTVVAKPNLTTKIVDPKAKAPDDPPDSQILADLPDLTIRSRGLYYAKWKVDGVLGATFCRLGSDRPTQVSNDEKKPVPAGMIGTVVPLDVNTAVFSIIPDPKLACVEPAASPSQN